MKPKRRDNQKQTSRMWLRNHDHRDIIYDMKYHYMIYLYKMKRDKEGQPTSEVETNDYVWIKYPHNSLLHIIKNTSNNPAAVGWIDIDRQFSYALANALHNNYIGMDHPMIFDGQYACFFHIDTRDNHWYCCITKDGIHWKLPEKQGGFNPPVFRLSTDCTCDFRYQVSGTWLNLMLRQLTISSNMNITESVNVKVILCRDADDESSTTYVRDPDDRVIKMTQRHSDFIFICPIDNGCLIRKQILTMDTNYEYNERGEVINTTHSLSSEWQYWEIDINGNYFIISDEMREPPQYVDGNTFSQNQAKAWIRNNGDAGTGVYGDNDRCSRCTHGSTSVFSYFTYKPVLRNNEAWYQYEIPVFTIRNNGTTIYGSTLYSSLVRSSSPVAGATAKIKTFFRRGMWYVLWATTVGSFETISKKTYLYSSADGVSWNEIPLPRWLDVPYSTESGAFTYRNEYADTVRIALSPTETEDADYDLFDLEWDKPNVMLKDGAIPENNDVFYICFYKRHTSSTPGILLYFDNPYLAENAQSFAMKLVEEPEVWHNAPYSMNEIYDIAEEVKDYDYCAPPGGFAGQEPDPDTSYIYYVYNFDTQDYDVVDRHLSTYEHYVIVIVTELPQVGEANTIYGVPADINKNNIYEYYVWSGNDFIEAKDLTIYAHHQLLVVETLPYTGAANIIYAVPIDQQAFSTHMYIWNPDAIIIGGQGAYEDINTTSYDMTNKKYTTVNVKSLPERGRVGIIYISEEAYNPNKVTHQDSTYNFYQWDPGNGKYAIVAPVLNTSKFTIIEVTELPSGPPGPDWPKYIYKIPKELDGKDTHDMYESEAKLLEFLHGHTFKHSTFLNSTDELPLVGAANVYYIIKEPPTQYSGFYTVYVWNWIDKKYDKKSEYEYWISDDPEDPKQKRILKILVDFIF